MKINVRDRAFKALKDIFINKSYSNLAAIKYSRDLDGREKAFLRELMYGTLENSIYYEWIISKFSKIKMKKIDEDVKIIMKTAIHQILCLDRIPDSAAVNEAVKLVGKYSNRGAKGFANGVLRSISRKKDSLPEISRKDMAEYLSVRYSYQKWMIKMWIDDYGAEFTEELCRANNERHYMNIRVNGLKADAEEIERFLSENGYEFEKSEYSDMSYKIENPSGLVDSEIYRDGKIDIHDITSVMAAEALSPQPGENILDICAAPGGKTGCLADIMDNRGSISARDIYENKISQIEEKMKRLGVSCVKAETGDAEVFGEEDTEKWDRCLADVPCSALGLIRNKPEIKYFRTEESMELFPETQMNILKNASEYVEKGGTLVYSTCSINRRENEELVKRFLEENPEFELSDFSSDIKKSIISDDAEKGMIQFFPNVHGTNGFFIAKMKKNEN